MTMRMAASLEGGTCCSDLARLAQFCVEALGREAISTIEVPAAKSREAALSSDPYRVMRLQTPRGERIKLLQPSATPNSRGEPEWLLELRNAAYPTFIVDDLDAMLHHLGSSGARLLTGPAKVEVRPGVWPAFVRDPEGNVLECGEYRDLAAYRSDLGCQAPAR